MTTSKQAKEIKQNFDIDKELEKVTKSAVRAFTDSQDVHQQAIKSIDLIIDHRLPTRTFHLRLTYYTKKETNHAK